LSLEALSPLFVPHAPFKVCVGGLPQLPLFSLNTREDLEDEGGS